jgi:hypothetical protein
MNYRTIDFGTKDSPQGCLRAHLIACHLEKFNTTGGVGGRITMYLPLHAVRIAVADPEELEKIWLDLVEPSPAGSYWLSASSQSITLVAYVDRTTEDPIAKETPNGGATIKGLTVSDTQSRPPVAGPIAPVSKPKPPQQPPKAAPAPGMMARFKNRFTGGA